MGRPVDRPIMGAFAARPLFIPKAVVVSSLACAINRYQHNVNRQTQQIKISRHYHTIYRSGVSVSPAEQHYSNTTGYRHIAQYLS